MKGKNQLDFDIKKAVNWLIDTLPNLIPQVFLEDLQTVIPELRSHISIIMQHLWKEIEPLIGRDLESLTPEEIQQKLRNFFDILFRETTNDIPADEPALPYIHELLDSVASAFSDVGYLAQTRYQKYHRIMEQFAQDIIRSGKIAEAQDLLNTMDRSPDGLVLVQSLFARTFRTMEFLDRRFNRPSQETTEHCIRIYHDLASLTEKFLPLLLSLDHLLLHGKAHHARPQFPSLYRLLHWLENSQRLAPIRQVINRHVRNAIAHGRVLFNPRTRKCEFVDKKTSVIWSFMEVLRQTRELSAAIVAMWQFRLLFLRELLRILCKMLYREKL